MISRNDLILLLTELEDQGENVSKELNTLMINSSIPSSVLKFINQRRHFDVANFYDLIRRNYNSKKSSLYINLVRESFNDPNEVLITLSALNLQIMLYAKKLDDNKMFLKHSRGEEIAYVLNHYYKTYDLIPCLKLIRLIKADLKSFEAINR